MPPSLLRPCRRCLLALALIVAASAADSLRAAGPSLQQYLEALGYVAVPFDSSDSSGYFHLDALVNGRSVRFLIDTGTSFTMLDTAKAKGIKTLGELNQKIKDSEGRIISNPNILLIDQLQLGQVRFSHQPALKNDLDVDSLRVGFGGLLGMDFINRNCCLIDCGDQKLYLRATPLSPPQLAAMKQSLANSGFISVPLHRGRRLQVDSKINGQPLSCMIDTGDRYTLIDTAGEKLLGLHPVTESRAGTNIPQPKLIEMRGLNKIGLGRQTAHVLKVHQFEVGQRKWMDLYIIGSDITVAGDHPIGEESRLHGIMGAELLTNDGAILDPRDGTMWFRRAAPDRY